MSLDSSKTQLTLQQINKRLQRSILKIISDQSFKNKMLAHRLGQTHPEKKLQADQQKVDDLGMRLELATWNYFNLSKNNQQQLDHRLLRLSPFDPIVSAQQTNRDFHRRLKQSMQGIIHGKQQCFVHNIERLHLVSPLATISRGYSVIRSQQGNIIKRLEQVNVGDDLSVQVANGHIQARVTKLKGNS